MTDSTKATRATAPNAFDFSQFKAFNALARGLYTVSSHSSNEDDRHD